MDWRVRLPSALYRLAREKAGTDAALAEKVVQWLDQWVNGTSPQALGGKARAERLTPEARQAIARQGGQARQATSGDSLARRGSSAPPTPDESE